MLDKRIIYKLPFEQLKRKVFIATYRPPSNWFGTDFWGFRAISSRIGVMGNDGESGFWNWI